MIRWEATKAEHELMVKIADRFTQNKNYGGLSYRELLMDLNATHSNGCPLKLQELLDAPDLDFFHDVAGITRHLDRKTGKLTNYFLPRYAWSE
jgi:hypothetical protein